MAAGPARPTGPATGTGRARGTPRAETALGPGGTRTVPARSARAESRMRTTGARRTLRPHAGTALRRAAGRRGATGRTGAARAAARSGIARDSMAHGRGGAARPAQGVAEASPRASRRTAARRTAERAVATRRTRPAGHAATAGSVRSRAHGGAAGRTLTARTVTARTVAEGSPASSGRAARETAAEDVAARRAAGRAVATGQIGPGGQAAGARGARTGPRAGPALAAARAGPAQGAGSSRGAGDGVAAHEARALEVPRRSRRRRLGTGVLCRAGVARLGGVAGIAGTGDLLPARPLRPGFRSGLAWITHATSSTGDNGCCQGPRGGLRPLLRLVRRPKSTVRAGERGERVHVEGPSRLVSVPPMRTAGWFLLRRPPSGALLPGMEDARHDRVVPRATLAHFGHIHPGFAVFGVLPRR